MAVDYMAKGQVRPIIYFENAKGHIMMAPTDEDARRFRYTFGKLGFEMMYADTLPKIEKLAKRLQEQIRTEQQIELARDEAVTAAGRSAVRQRLIARMNAPGTPPGEREFIKYWLEYREKKHDIFKKKFTSFEGVLHILEYDEAHCNEHIADLHERVK